MKLKDNQRLRVATWFDTIVFDLVKVNSEYHITGGTRYSLPFNKIPSKNLQAQALEVIIESLQYSYNKDIEPNIYPINDVANRLSVCGHCLDKGSIRFYYKPTSFNNEGYALVNSQDSYKVEFECLCPTSVFFTGTIEQIIAYFNNKNLDLFLTKFAKIWLQETGRESLTETMQGFNFIEDSYRQLPSEIKTSVNQTTFLDLLQKKVGELF